MSITPRHVEDLIHKWRSRLRLERWDIVFDLVNTEFDMPEDSQSDVAAVTSADEYFSAKIIFCKENIELDELEEVVVHELLHVKMFTMEQIIRDALEDNNPRLSEVMIENQVEELTAVLMGVSQWTQS